MTQASRAPLSRADRLERLRDFRDRVKNAYNIVDAMRDEGVELKKQFGHYSSCCPFHVEKTPSFNVNPDRGTYKCFGAGCEVGGDVFTFLQDIHGIDFSSALRLAAERSGVDASEIFSGPTPMRKRRKTAPLSERLRAHRFSPVPAHIEKPTTSPLQAGTRKPKHGYPFSLWKPKTNSVKTYRSIEMIHDYKDVDGSYIMSILRLNFPDRDTGKRVKVFIPARYMETEDPMPSQVQPKQTKDGKTHAWVARFHTNPEARPIYGLERASDAFQQDTVNILIVEGEKTCDAARRLIADEGWLVITPQGGGKSAHHGWWKPIIELMRKNPDSQVRFTVWPDADDPVKRPDGTEEERRHVFGEQIHHVLKTWMQKEDYACDRVDFDWVQPPSDKGGGWDLADAEEEKWTGGDVVTYMKNNRKPINEIEGQDKTSQSDAEVSPNLDPFSQEAQVLSEEARNTADDFDIENGAFLDPEESHSMDENGEAADTPNSEEPGSSMALGDLGDLGDFAEPESGDGDNATPTHTDRAMNNQYFRALGYSNGLCHFFSKRPCQIMSLKSDAVSKQNLFGLAPVEHWKEWYAKYNQNGDVVGADYDAAISSVISAAFQAGYWTHEKEVRQGARLDGGRVVFNTGSSLYIVGEGRCGLADFTGKYTYTSGANVRSPDFENPFTADSPEIRQMINIIKNISWRKESENISIMAFLGWLVIGPICGVLPHRPHIWLDGPRSSGKSWIIQNIVTRVFGDYCLNLVSSTEPGVRRGLDSCFIPAVYDEAEANKRSKGSTIQDIIGLSRTAANNTKSMILQASGTGTVKYEICSTFMMSSITPQLIDSADKTRFGGIHLDLPHTGARFEDKIRRPSRELFTPEFSSRLIARMIMRAHDYQKTADMMMETFIEVLRAESRTGDVYGAFAAGAWLLLREGAPESKEEVVEFLESEFGAMTAKQIHEITLDINEDRDHLNLVRKLISTSLKFDGSNSGLRSERMGVLLRVAMGYDDEPSMISQTEALNILSSYDVRIGTKEGLYKPGETATHILIHSKSQIIPDILEDTPYANGYSGVIKQGGNVKVYSSPVRFGGSGPSRPLAIPIENFPI